MAIHTTILAVFLLSNMHPGGHAQPASLCTCQPPCLKHLSPNFHILPASTQGSPPPRGLCRLSRLKFLCAPLSPSIFRIVGLTEIKCLAYWLSPCAQVNQYVSEGRPWCSITAIPLACCAAPLLRGETLCWSDEAECMRRAALMPCSGPGAHQRTQLTQWVKPLPTMLASPTGKSCVLL